MRSRRFLAMSSLAITLSLAAASLTLAHTDDPKSKEVIRVYEGPGYRAANPTEGIIENFDRNGIWLSSWVTLPEFAGNQTGGNDCWGYTSPSGGEYAIMCMEGGTGFVDISDPDNAVVLATILGPQSTWRDAKTFSHYAYIVTEASGGIQVVDLSDIDNGNVTLVNQIESNSSHNVAIDTESGFLYRCGGSYYGLGIYDLNPDPASPQLVASWSSRYVHDLQAVTYTEGPYAGKQVVFLCGGNNGGWVDTGIEILDVTDKQNITQMDRLIYPNGEYSHQCWLSEDRQYLYLDDELDEDGTFPTKTFIFDVSDLNNIVEAGSFGAHAASTGHNLYVKGDRIFAANYQAGVRVFDASNPLSPGEMAYFDTYPDNNGAGYSGLWSVYPFFESGVFIGSDRQRGLFVWQLESDMKTVDGDFDQNGIVDTADLLLMLAAWGDCAGCIEDLDENGTVDVADVLLLLSYWT